MQEAEVQPQLGNQVDCTFYPFGKTEGKHVDNIDGKFYPKTDDDGEILDLASSPETASTSAEADDAAASPEAPAPLVKADDERSLIDEAGDARVTPIPAMPAGSRPAKRK